MATVGEQLSAFGLPAMRCHMHTGANTCGPFRCDDVTDMQVEGLDALEDAAGHDSPARAARQHSDRRPPSMIVEMIWLGLYGSLTLHTSQQHIQYSSASSLTPIAASQTCHMSGSNPATGNHEFKLHTVRLC